MRGTVWTKVVNIKVHCINIRVTFKLVQQRFFLTYPWLSYLRNRTRSIWAGSGTSVCRRENPLLPETHTAYDSRRWGLLLAATWLPVTRSQLCCKAAVWWSSWVVICSKVCCGTGWKRRAEATVMFPLQLLHLHFPSKRWCGSANAMWQTLFASATSTVACLSSRIYILTGSRHSEFLQNFKCGACPS